MEKNTYISLAKEYQAGNFKFTLQLNSFLNGISFFCFLLFIPNPVTFLHQNSSIGQEVKMKSVELRMWHEKYNFTILKVTPKLCCVVSEIDEISRKVS